MPYPIAVDSDYGVWNAFDNHYWPAVYIADAQGRIRYHHFGEGEYAMQEMVIQQLLLEAGAEDVDLDLVSVDPVGLEVAADYRTLRSPETYLGYGQATGMASPDGLRADEAHDYTPPTSLRLNEWAPAGGWSISRRAATATAPNARLAFRFQARDVNLVMGPAVRGTAIPFRVYLDGQPATGAHGTDVDADGNGTRRGAADLPTHPPTGPDHRARLRDRVPRPGRRALLLHLRLIRGTGDARGRRALGSGLFASKRGRMMDATGSAEGDAVGEVWPALPNEAWQDTLDTLHMWTQIVGKTKLELVPFLNQWWEVGFTVTARGMTTSTIPFGHRVFQIDFDFLDHRLDILVNDGRTRSIPLHPQSVADFYQEFMGALAELGIRVRITTNPVEVENTIPFDQDRVHASYDPEYVNALVAHPAPGGSAPPAVPQPLCRQEQPGPLLVGLLRSRRDPLLRPTRARTGVADPLDGPWCGPGAGLCRLLAGEREGAGAGLLRLHLSPSLRAAGRRSSSRTRPPTTST